MGKYAPKPTIRILMLGSVGVGKNCLESRFTTMTYPPPYNPALTLNSRRYFTLPPIHAAGDCVPDETSPTEEEDSSTKKGAVIVSAVERPRTNSSTSSINRASGPVAAAPDNASFDDRTLVASSEATCSECARENNTYLVEVMNYPTLQNAAVRRQVHSKADYDAVLLVYDVQSSVSFDAVTALHAEIPVCTRKNHHQHHRKAVPHASATRSRTSGWFGGGGNETGTTGSGEIVVGLVGNKSDIDEEVEDEKEKMAAAGLSRREYINGDGMDEDGEPVEDSLLHPLYRESILYEELMATREEKEKKAAAAKAARSQRPEVAETPTTPFPIGVPPLSPAAQLRIEASKSEDIQKWLQISRPEPSMPLSPTSPTSPTRNVVSLEQRDYFGSTGGVNNDIDGNDDTMTAATPANTPALQLAKGSSTSANSTRQKTQPSPSRRREVPTTDGAMLAQALQLPVPFLETSAKTGRHVEQALENIVREVLREMGRDASGTNKAGKTCRHRANNAVELKEKEKEKEKHPSHHHHFETAVVVPVASPTKVAPPHDIVVHDIAIQRPESAAMFRDKKAWSDGVEGGNTAEDSQAVVDGDPALTVLPNVHRRESVMGRMRKFWRKSQQQQGVVMPADIAV